MSKQNKQEGRKLKRKAVCLETPKETTEADRELNNVKEKGKKNKKISANNESYEKLRQ